MKYLLSLLALFALGCQTQQSAHDLITPDQLHLFIGDENRDGHFGVRDVPIETDGDVVTLGLSWNLTVDRSMQRALSRLVAAMEAERCEPKPVCDERAEPEPRCSPPDDECDEPAPFITCDDDSGEADAPESAGWGHPDPCGYPPIAVACDVPRPSFWWSSSFWACAIFLVLILVALGATWHQCRKRRC